MTKRTVPSLAVFLTLALFASDLAHATRGKGSSIPEVITVSDAAVSTGDGYTEVILNGDFPLNYLVYQPALNRVVVEVQDCDASAVSTGRRETTELIEFQVSTEMLDDRGPISRFTFVLAPGVSHKVSPSGTDLQIRLTSPAVAPPLMPSLASSSPAAVAPAMSNSRVGAPAVRPAAAAATPPVDGLIGYRAIGVEEYANRAGVDSTSPGRALVGIDTAASDSGRIVLLLDGAVAYSTFELTNPSRLVVDLQGLSNEVATSAIDVDSTFLRRIRVSQFKDEPDRVARTVFDLSRAVSYEVNPTAEGLSVQFQRATLPARPDMEVADSEPLPATPVAAVEASIEDLLPADESTLAQVNPVDDEFDESAYTYYNEAQPNPTPIAGVKPSMGGLTFESKTISDERAVYTGRRISLELVDADLKQVFRLFHDISGLNFVLDPSVSGKVTIVLDNVPWDQALDIILRNNGMDKVFENNVMRIATTGKLAAEAQERRALKEASRLEQDPVTVSRILSYAKANELDPILRRILSSRGQSFFDARTNTVIVTDIPEKIDAVNTLLDDLDTRTPQVMIEARIVETSRNFTRDLGIDWGFLANDARGAGNNFTGEFDLNLPRVAGASRLGITFGDLGPNGFSLDLALDALEVEGRGRVLSAPKVAAQNNSTALIEQGTQIPVVNTTATEINVEFISASLKLEVTPQITAEGTVIMDIRVDNSSPDFDNLVGDTPSINTERASTRVLVEDGGTTVIGGVFLLNEGESVTGVPGLRKIPGLGWLFKNKNITKENRELLIFITPRIML